jgi:thioredoxin 1
MSKITFEVTNENFQEQVLQSPVPVLVDFWADWCPPCKMLAPLVDQIAAKYQGRLSVGKLDVDAYPDMPERFNIYGFPTMILFKDGQPVHSVVGFRTRDYIEREILPYLPVAVEG